MIQAPQQRQQQQQQHDALRTRGARTSQAAPIKSRSMTAEAARKIGVEHARQLAADLPREVGALRLNACMWVPRFLSDLTNHDDKREVLAVRSTLLIHGLRLAHRLRQLVHATICTHLDLQLPIPKPAIGHLLNALELLSAVADAFDRRTSHLADTALHACRLLASQLIRLLSPVKAKLENSRRLDDSALDRLAAITLAISSLHAPPTPTRLTTLQLALHVAQLKGAMREAEHDEVSYLIWKLGLVAEHQDVLA